MPDPRALSSEQLLALVVNARWFAASDRVPEEAEVVGVPVEDGLVTLAIVEVRFGPGTHEHYLSRSAGGEAADAFERPRSPPGSRRWPACGRGRARAAARASSSRTARSSSTSSTC